MIEHASVRQQRLAKLMRAITGMMIRVDDAMRVLNLDRIHAAKLLAGWHKQGVIRRISRGLYVPIQPSALGQSQVLDDPWVLVPELYEPGYVGGWSALEYWELTEQLFRSVCVLTNRRTAYGDKKLQGVDFFIKYIPGKHVFGTKTIWRHSVKVRLSDPYKTVLDIVDDPILGAGVQHTIDCLSAFKKIYDSRSDEDRLMEYAIQMNNGALFKKLGYLAEKLEFSDAFVNECAGRLTTGYTYLDKNSKNKRLVTKWRVWIPKGLNL